MKTNNYTENLKKESESNRRAIGMLRNQRLTYREIGDVLGFTKQRVHQIYKNYHPSNPLAPNRILKKEEKFFDKYHAYLEANKVLVTCANVNCKKEYKVIKSLVRKRNYCSIECNRIGRVRITPEERKRRHKISMKNWEIRRRKDVVWWERYQKRKRVYITNYYYEHSKDPEWRKKQNQRSNAVYRRNMQDPKFRKIMVERTKKYYSNKMKDPAYREKRSAMARKYYLKKKLLK